MLKRSIIITFAASLLLTGCSINLDPNEDPVIRLFHSESSAQNKDRSDTPDDIEDEDEISDEEFNKLTEQIIQEKLNNYTPESEDLDLDESHDVIRDKQAFIDNYLTLMRYRGVSDRQVLLYKDHYFKLLPDNYLTSDMYLAPTKYYGGYRKQYKSDFQQDIRKSGFTIGQEYDLDEAEVVLKSFVAESFIHNKDYVWSDDMDRLMDNIDKYISLDNKALHIDYLYAVDGDLGKQFPGSGRGNTAVLATAVYSDADIDGWTRLPNVEISISIGDASRGKGNYGWGALMRDVSLEAGGNGEVPEDCKDSFFDDMAAWEFDDDLKNTKELHMEDVSTEIGDDYYMIYYTAHDGSTSGTEFSTYRDGVIVNIKSYGTQIMDKKSCEELVKEITK